MPWCILNASHPILERFFHMSNVQLLDDPEAYHGAPVAVQVIGRRLTEERTMVIAEEIGRLLKQ